VKELVPYALRVEMRRASRWLADARQWPKPTRRRTDNFDAYPYLLVSHSSRLIKRVDRHLRQFQLNKVHNLRLACARMDGLLIERDEVFSFCRLVGRTGRWRGYLRGLEMHNGELGGAPGGGLCQLSNLVYWMALHLDQEILERHRHGFDLFPDEGRKVPFGMGATVFYNYLDLRFRNSLEQPLLLRVSVQPPLLCGALYSDRDKPFDVQIVETAHRFFRDAEGVVWRENRVMKQVSYRDGRAARLEEVAHNVAKVRYDVAEEMIDTQYASEPASGSSGEATEEHQAGPGVVRGGDSGIRECRTPGVSQHNRRQCRPRGLRIDDIAKQPCARSALKLSCRPTATSPSHRALFR